MFQGGETSSQYVEMRPQNGTFVPAEMQENGRKLIIFIIIIENI